MKIAIVVFDRFTDIDVFLMWDLLNRVRGRGWEVRLVGQAECHISTTSIPIPMHERLDWANQADAVLFTSGPGTRLVSKDESFLSAFALQPDRQLIGSMCSGALILAALNLLKGPATTYPTAKGLLEAHGVEVVEKPFVVNGNVATAAGCLAAQYLAGWVIERLADARTREVVLSSIQPVGEGLAYDSPSLESLYAPPENRPSA